MTRRILRLVPLALQPDDLATLDWLGTALAERLPIVPVETAPLPLDRAWLDPERGQYSSNLVIEALIDSTGGPSRLPDEWTLAVTAVDLYAPGRDFVLGEAAYQGAWAVISLARLRDLAWVDDTELVRSRALREALHELGHLVGLDHCAQPGCVMATSCVAEEVDRKGAAYCAGCRPKLDGGLDPGTSDD